MTKPAAPRPLTRKQQVFFDAYIKNYDARAAYLEAGYDAKDVNCQAYALLRHAQIAKMLEAHRTNLRLEYKDIHSDMVTRLRDMINADTDDFTTWDENKSKLIPSKDIPKSKKKAVTEISSSVSTTQRKDRDGNVTSSSVRVRNRVKLVDKIKAMELLAKITGIMKDDAEEKIAGATQNIVVFKTSATPDELAAEYDKPISSD